MTGCGGGGGSVAGTSGIGGTGVRVAGVGIGTTTGFGSVIINDVRVFTIAVDNNVKGPVTAINPLTVLGQNIVATGDTVLRSEVEGLVDGSGPAGNIQVEVRGFVDSSGTVFANEVRERGTADLTDVRLRGPATDTCDPSIADNELAIIDVIVDTGTSFFDASGTQLDNTAFCNLVSTGTAVQAENGTFSSSPARIDNAGSIEIED